MGILGLTSIEGFSDRLFNSFDTDTDGKVYSITIYRFLSKILLSTWKYSSQAMKKTKPEYLIV